MIQYFWLDVGECTLVQSLLDLSFDTGRQEAHSYWESEAFLVRSLLEIFDDNFQYNFGPLALSRSGVLKEIDVRIFDIWIFHSSETRSPLTVVFHSWIYWQGLLRMGNVQIILAVWFFHAALLSSRGVEAACLRKFGSEH